MDAKTREFIEQDLVMRDLIQQVAHLLGSLKAGDNLPPIGSRVLIIIGGSDGGHYRCAATFDESEIPEILVSCLSAHEGVEVLDGGLVQ